MSTRRQRSQQKGKDGKRPRSFHRGRAQGRLNERLMQEVLEPAYAAAEADREEVAAVSESHRRQQSDYADCLRQLERSSPFTLAGFPVVLG